MRGLKPSPRIAIFSASSMLCMVSMLGCMSTTDGDAPPRRFATTADGLEMVEFPMPGVLELRPDHGIGSYDAIMIPRAALRYKRGSVRLVKAAERVFLTLLQRSLLDGVEASPIPIEQTAGLCVMEINLLVHGLDLDPSRRADQLADMTLVMEFRDSTSREPLLRYATENLIENPRKGTTHNKQLQRGFDRIIRQMDITEPLRAAGLADDTVAPGCNGTLAAYGRAAQKQR